MLKKINTVEQLPSWFSIKPYTEWRDENPEEATRAIDDRLGFLQMIKLYSLVERDTSIGMEWLQKGSREPWKRLGVEPMTEMMIARQDAYLKQEGLEEFNRAEADREEELTYSEGERIAREIADEYFDPGQDEIDRVNLWEVMDFLKQNESMIRKVDEAAILLAEKHELDFECVRDMAYRHISLSSNNDRGGYIWIDSHPTAEIVSQQVKRFLLKHDSGGEVPFPRVGPAEVRKLFDYRVAAYIDLKIWEHLTNSEITNKCMARALFPDGEYGAGDMSPSKTLGNILNRVVYEAGYMDSLMAKASQMETLKDV